MEQSDFQALAAFRYEVRRFMSFSRSLLTSEGIDPKAYQAMLAIQAHAFQDYTIGDLASELFLKVHTVVELIDRMQSAGWVNRKPSPMDRRRILLSLTPQAQRSLPRLAEMHLVQLRMKAPELVAALSRLSDGHCQTNGAGYGDRAVSAAISSGLLPGHPRARPQK